MRTHCKLLLVLPFVVSAPAAAAAADTEAACATFSQATALVNTDLSPFLGFARKEGWSYDDPGMADAIEKASIGLAQAGRDVDSKLADTEPGPAQNALRHYSATATELGQKIAHRAAFADLTSTVDAYNAAVHTANGACGLGIGG
ncbi:hypothetical protein Srot_1597 [Segniliparus rotundus DSM 44985]|uniref:Uncharacterized protein n=1 Tax=Segniliparus rotundus (strain ATCC BAA-972 / CDC 1076 / CIP 108378 / DSM 44985 / JCM 13578) TaxID=640132 RepID=D6Z7X9_SEGRD|nr:hypothetical protein [Segniliparus rotundus]ADG98059.1 hypothetical protein Srot_1597 [Segniliparus rotundus DSM 44985]